MAKVSYGGFIVTPNHGVILVSPTRNYSGVHWTFPKGQINDGENPEQGAIREVEEESGLKCEIICQIPDQAAFTDSYNKNVYYLMRIVANSSSQKNVKSNYFGKEYKNDYSVGETDAESDFVIEASRLAAKELIQKTTSSSEKARDLALLEAGYHCYDEWLRS